MTSISSSFEPKKSFLEKGSAFFVVKDNVLHKAVVELDTMDIIVLSKSDDKIVVAFTMQDFVEKNPKFKFKSYTPKIEDIFVPFILPETGANEIYYSLCRPVFNPQTNQHLIKTVFFE